MIKILTVSFWIFSLFFTSCLSSDSRASKFALSNKRFTLDKFMKGSWEGKCYGSRHLEDKIVIKFLNDAAVIFEYNYHNSEMKPRKVTNFGLYEIKDEKFIELYNIDVGKVIEINKINEDSIEFSKNSGDSIIYGCRFIRVKK